jgi:hypothetical protein
LVIVTGSPGEALFEVLEVEIAQRPVEVVGPAHRSTGFHARVTGHGLAGGET